MSRKSGVRAPVGAHSQPTPETPRAGFLGHLPPPLHPSIHPSSMHLSYGAEVQARPAIPGELVVLAFPTKGRQSRLCIFCLRS